MGRATVLGAAPLPNGERHGGHIGRDLFDVVAFCRAMRADLKAENDAKEAAQRANKKAQSFNACAS